MKNSKKIFIIPGFLRPISFYNWCEGREVWNSDDDIKKRIDADYVVGYSLGAIGALINWKENKNTKLILIDPLLPKRSLLAWLWRWLKFIIFEGAKPRQTVSISKFFSGLKKARLWLRIDSMKILDEISPRDVLILRGERDDFFFDKKASEYLANKKFTIIEVKGVAHDWDEKIKIEIEKIILKY
jgi:hypothetical protein